MPELRMPSELTEDMRAAVHRARMTHQRSIGSPGAPALDMVDDEVATRVACPVQRGYDKVAYAVLLKFGVPVDG